MKSLLPASLLLCGVSIAWSQEKLAEFDWKSRIARYAVSHGELVSEDGRSVLKIENTNDSPLQVALFTLSKPPIPNLTYAVTGRIKYEGVHGDGYLEMWSYFPPLKPGLPEGQYFSRTMAASGEMAKMTGTSDWRNFSIPFDRTGASGPPTRLDVNLFLPGRGTVYLGPLTLVQYSGSAEGSSSGNPGASAWWTSRQSGIFGGILGSVGGILGGAIGLLAGSGKARRFVLLSHKVIIAAGCVLAVLGIAAIANGQPYHVWYPLLLGGVLAIVIFRAVLPVTRKRYNDLELRRMTAIDAT